MFLLLGWVASHVLQSPSGFGEYILGNREEKMGRFATGEREEMCENIQHSITNAGIRFGPRLGFAVAAVRS